MNKPLIAALIAAMAFSALPAFASTVSASANDQQTVISAPSTGMLVAQSSDNQSDSSAPAPQSNDKEQ